MFQSMLIFALLTVYSISLQISGYQMNSKYVDDLSELSLTLN